MAEQESEESKPDTRSRIEDRIFKPEVERAQRMPTDKDRRRIVNQIALQFKLTPEQCISLVKTFTYFSETIESCAFLLHSHTPIEEDSFIHLALDLCKFPEDRVEMCEKLDIDFVPLVAKDKPKPKPNRRMTVNTGLGVGKGFVF